MEEQYSFIKIKLSQAHYKRGYLYVSAITNVENEIVSYDFRYFVDDHDLIPTQNGFRISHKLSNEFMYQITKNPSNEDYCYELTKERSLYIRYLEDSNGEFIDIRNYVISEKFTGWTKQGIRFLLSDYKSLQNEVIKFINNDFSIKNYENFFESKVITSKSKSKKKLNKSSTDTYQTNPDLLKIINS